MTENDREALIDLIGQGVWEEYGFAREGYEGVPDAIADAILAKWKLVPVDSWQWPPTGLRVPLNEWVAVDSSRPFILYPDGRLIYTDVPRDSSE